MGAWASDQSRPLERATTFEARYDEMKRAVRRRRRSAAAALDRISGDARAIEFWTDRPHRLHERRLFVRDGDGWTEGLLYP